MTAGVLKMHFSFQVYFLAVFLVLTVNGADNSTKSCAKPYDKMMVCNLMCNFLQDSDANNAIKMLQAKLESIIAVLNKPSPTLPPGKMICFQCCSRLFFRMFQIATVACYSSADREARASWKILRLSTPLFLLSCLSCLARASINKGTDRSCMYFILVFLKTTSYWIFTFFTAVPASSCKEQYEKRR